MSDPSGGTPRWQQRAASPLLAWWWALWLVSGAAGLLALRAWVPTEDWDELRRAARATFASDSMNIPCAIVTLLVVRSIHGMQERSRYTTVFD